VPAACAGDDCIAVCFIDKNINDAFGHSPGDTVLRLVVSLILPKVRQQDALVRYAGDEFL